MQSDRMGTGNPAAKIMLIGECFNYEEGLMGEAFLGQAGAELNRMLSEAGITRSECYVTNVCNARPPQDDLGKWIAYKFKDRTANHRMLFDLPCLPQVHEGYARLMREVEIISPDVIVAFGNVAMWALTGATGVLKWRGSSLGMRNAPVTPSTNAGDTTHPSDTPTAATAPKSIVVIPTLHPVQTLYAWENRALVIADLKRVKQHLAGEVRPLEWNFKIRPSFQTVSNTLNELLEMVEAGPTWIDFDLETRAGHIACAGLSWSLNDAICIPLMTRDSIHGYWAPEEETAIVYQLYKLLTHPDVMVRGQNLLYDCQYTYRHWHFVPRVWQDTMISHHTCFAGLPKSLAFQASLYCNNYIYWKEDK